MGGANQAAFQDNQAKEPHTKLAHMRQLLEQQAQVELPAEVQGLECLAALLCSSCFLRLRRRHHLQFEGILLARISYLKISTIIAKIIIIEVPGTPSMPTMSNPNSSRPGLAFGTRVISSLCT